MTRWSSISIRKLTKQTPIFSIGSLEEATISRLIKKINLNPKRHQTPKVKQKVRVHNPRSCNPDTIKLHLMKSIPKTSSQHVTIDLKAKICLPRKIVMPDSLNEKATLNQASNSNLKKDNQLKENLKVKTSKGNNLKTNQQNKAKIHSHRLLQDLSNVQLTLDALTYLNTLKRKMDKKRASCQTATT